MAAACTSFPRAVVSNAWSPASATSRVWSPDGTLHSLQAFGGASRSARPSTSWAWMESRRVPSGPTCSVNSARFMPPGILTAGASPSGERSARMRCRFLTVPLDDGSVTDAGDIRAGPAGPRERLGAGRFVWAPSRRYIYFEGRAGDTQNVWRVTVDPLTEKWIDGPERLTTGAGEETNVAISPDGTRLVFTTTSSRTRLWAFPFDSASGRITGQPYPITDGSTGEVDFDARADGSKVAYRDRPGRPQRVVGTIDWRRTGAAAAVEHGLATRRNRGGLRTARSSRSRAVRRGTTRAGGRRAQYGWQRRARVDAGPAGSRCRGPTGRKMARRSSAPVDSVRPSDTRRAWFRLERERRLAIRRSGSSRRIPSAISSTSGSPPISAGSRFSRTICCTPRRRRSTSSPAAGGTWRAITDGTWFDDKPRWGPDGRILYFVSNRTGVANVWGRRFDNSTGTPIGEPFAVTSFRSAQFVLTPRTVQMDIAITATHLLLPMSESRSEIWMLDQVDR